MSLRDATVLTGLVTRPVSGDPLSSSRQTAALGPFGRRPAQVPGVPAGRVTALRGKGLGLQASPPRGSRTSFDSNPRHRVRAPTDGQRPTNGPLTVDGPLSRHARSSAILERAKRPLRPPARRSRNASPDPAAPKILLTRWARRRTATAEPAPTPARPRGSLPWRTGTDSHGRSDHPNHWLTGQG